MDDNPQEQAVWSNAPVPLSRGRAPRDPAARTVSFEVSSLEEFESSLRLYLHTPEDSPEHTDCQLSFWIGTSFLVSAPPQTQSTQPPVQQQAPHHQLQQHQQQQQQQRHPQPHLANSHDALARGYQPANNGIRIQHQHQHQHGAPSHTYQSVSDPAIALSLPSFPHSSSPNGSNNGGKHKNERKMSMSVQEALRATSDPKEKMRKQRAIAKCCVECIQRVDGYRYSFHNCWNSREDDSFRFSYYCNDSLLNKDRAANGKGAKFGKRATKPVYDCKGVLSVKFSATKQSLDVFYKHVPVHKTYEERAPPPRKDSKRRKFLEENDPEALIRIVNRPKPVQYTEDLTGGAARPRERKKKKSNPPEEPKAGGSTIEADLRTQSLQSLLSLIRGADDAPSDPPAPQSDSVAQQSNSNEPTQEPPQQRQPPPLPPPPAPKKRIRNTCDVCKAKKTKCDGTRPVCNTCATRNRQCGYSLDPPDERQHPPPMPSEVALPAQAAENQLSELEQMKKQLEAAQARIQQLEAEKDRSSSTPVQTPQQHSRPQSQSQPQPQPQLQPQPPSQQQHHPTPQQAQSQSTPNVPQIQPVPQRAPRPQAPQQQQHHQHSTPQQQQQQQQQQHQQHQAQQQQHQPRQQQPKQHQHHQHQQQNQAQQQMPTQQPQIAPQQYNQFATAANAANASPYALNRTMSAQAGAPQGHQIQPTGLTPTPETSNPYGREFIWPSTPYYNYPAPTQQHQQHQHSQHPHQQHPQQPHQQQQDQWAAARNNSVFRPV